MIEQTRLREHIWFSVCCLLSDILIQIAAALKEHLPYDVLLMIFSRADRATVVLASRVSQLWHEAAQSAIWRQPRDLRVLFEVLAPMQDYDGVMVSE